MRTFRDATGREWLVAITVADIKRTRSLVGVDIYGLVDGGFKGLGDLLGDVVKLVDVLYVLCLPECQTRGVTDEDFGRLMAGDPIQSATDAFLGALTDFFPDPRVRAGLAKVIAAGKRVTDLVLDRMGPEIDRIDVEAVANALRNSPTSAPESSASIPARSASVS